MDLLVTTLSYTNETIWLQIKNFSATITPSTLEGKENWLPEVPIFVSSIKALIIFVIKSHNNFNVTYEWKTSLICCH